MNEKEILDRIRASFNEYTTLVDPLMEVKTRNSETVGKHMKYKENMERCLYYVVYSLVGDDEQDMQDMLDELDNVNEEIRVDMRNGGMKVPKKRHLRLV